LTGSPDESGAKRREQGLARAGNARVRFYVVFASAGGFLAPAISAAINMEPCGWRRVAMLGFVDPQSRGLPTSVALALSQLN
jgi:hypothetical protein